MSSRQLQGKVVIPNLATRVHKGNAKKLQEKQKANIIPPTAKKSHGQTYAADTTYQYSALDKNPLRREGEYDHRCR